MTKQTSLEELGRRAVACKRWRWMPGMLLLPHAEDCECCEDRNIPRRAARVPAVFTTDIDVPNLSDPATLGCLLHLVREAWPDEWHEFMVPIFDGFSHWRVGCLDLQRLPGAPKLIVPVDQETMKPLVWAYGEAEALVIALEAAH